MRAVPDNLNTRLDFRVSPEHKLLIERAASAQGQTISGFAIATLVKAANEVIRNESERTLSARDSHAFLAMIAEPAEPNTALKKAADRYKGRRER